MEIAELKQNVDELQIELDALSCYDDKGAENLIKKYLRLAPPMSEVGYIYASFSESKNSKKDEVRRAKFWSGVESLRVAIEDLVRYQ